MEPSAATRARLLLLAFLLYILDKLSTFRLSSLAEQLLCTTLTSTYIVLNVYDTPPSLYKEASLTIHCRPLEKYR